MRLRALSLDRYGRFEDRRLDFRKTGPIDLHLVYGPNEAGKSTIFAALEDLFFGLPDKSGYAFHFGQAMLKVSGEIEAEGRVQDVARVHNRKAPLVDRLDAPLPESVFGPEMERLDRETFRNLFSLDERSLREGGRLLLDAEGDAAEILFGSSLGLATVSERLKAMRKEAQEIYQFRAPTKQLYKLRSELQVIREKLKAADLKASDYDRLKRRRDETAAAADAAHEAAGAARQTLSRLQRIDEARADYDDYQRDAPRLEALAALPALPAGWSERAARLHSLDALVRTNVAAAGEALEELSSKIEAIRLDDRALALAERISSLAKLENGYEGALRSIPNRERDIAHLRQHAAAVAARLGAEPGADPEDFRLAPDRIATLERLSGRHIELAADQAAAARELKAAREAARRGVALDDTTRARLVAALEAATAGDPEGAARRTAEDVAAAERRLADALARLAPWQGTSDALLGQTPPTAAAIAAWRDRAQALDAEAATTRAERQALDAAAHAARLAALDQELGPGLSDDDFSRLRAERDALWADHRTALSPDTADAFARKAAEADAAADDRLAQADAVAGARKAVAEARRIALEAERLDGRDATIAAARQALRADTAAAATALGLPKDSDADALTDWLARREAALECRERAREAHGARAAADQRLVELDQDLRAALKAAGQTAPDDADLATLRVLATERAELARVGADAAAEVARREEADAAARAALAAWETEWRAATAGTWLAARAADAAFLREALPDIRQLRESLDEIAGQQLRVRQMESDRDAFVGEAMAVAQALDSEGAEDRASDDPLELAETARARLQAARQVETQLAELKQRAKDAEATLAAREAELRAHRAEIAEMAAHFGVDTLQETLEALKQADERDALAKAQARRAANLRRATAAETTEAALDAISEAASEALDAMIQEAASKADALTESAREADRAAAKASDAFEQASGDADAALLEQARQTKVMEIEDATRRHLMLAYGVAAAERAMARYRDAHRSAVLDRASAVFGRITRGSFSRLETQLRGGRETLLAVRPDGAAPINDDSMSEGARAQLYLALRIAAYEEFPAAPPPFVADDILETFDDDRARETFEALAEMATRGQVIYLTHHAHLIDIARAAAPGVRVHCLPDPVGGAAAKAANDVNEVAAGA